MSGSGSESNNIGDGDISTDGSYISRDDNPNAYADDEYQIATNMADDLSEDGQDNDNDLSHSSDLIQFSKPKNANKGSSDGDKVNVRETSLMKATNDAKKGMEITCTEKTPMSAVTQSQATSSVTVPVNEMQNISHESRDDEHQNPFLVHVRTANPVATTLTKVTNTITGPKHDQPLPKQTGEEIATEKSVDVCKQSPSQGRSMTTQTEWDLWGSPISGASSTLNARSGRTDGSTERMQAEWRVFERRAETRDEQQQVKLNILQSKQIETDNEVNRLRANLDSVNKKLDEAIAKLQPARSDQTRQYGPGPYLYPATIGPSAALQASWYPQYGFFPGDTSMYAQTAVPKQVTMQCDKTTTLSQG